MSTVLLFFPEQGLLCGFADAAGALAAWRPEALIFDANGEPLRREEAGRAFLRPWASCSACRLAQVLAEVGCLEGDIPLPVRAAWEQLHRALPAGGYDVGLNKE